MIEQSGEVPGWVWGIKEDQGGIGASPCMIQPPSLLKVVRLINGFSDLGSTRACSDVKTSSGQAEEALGF